MDRSQRFRSNAEHLHGFNERQGEQDEDVG